jgi:signal peptidase II
VSEDPSPAAGAEAVSLRRLKIATIVLLVVWCAADLWTKDYMQDLLGLVAGESAGARQIDVIPGFLAWEGTWNPGVTFGLAPHKTNLILALTGVATLGLMIWFLGTRSRSRLLHIGLALILAGALGNLYDRWNWGQVRDFILVYIGDLENPSWKWPNFNLADSGIVVGVGFVLWDALFGYSGQQAKLRAARKKLEKEQAGG